MVLQNLGRRINAAVSDLTRSPNLDEKVPHTFLNMRGSQANILYGRSMA